MKKMMILNLLFAAVSLMSCNTDVILDPQLPEYFVVEGDTVRVRDDRKTIDLLNKSYNTIFIGNLPIVGDTVLPYRKLTLPEISKKPDLSMIKSPANEGNPFRMIALTGELGIGLRDFGLFNEGMEASYPNLVAHQMGIDYNLPLFDKDDYNGFQRVVRTDFNPTGGPAIKLRRVVNNLGVGSIDRGTDGRNEIKLKPFDRKTDSYYSPTNDGSNMMSFYRPKASWGAVETELNQGKGFDFFILEARTTQFGDKISRHTVAELEKRDWEKYPKYGFAENEFMGGAPLANYQDNLVRWFKDHKVTKGVIVNLKYPDYRVTSKNYKEDLIKLMETYQLDGLYTTYGSTILDIPTYSYYQIKNGNYWVGGTNSTMDSLLAPNVNINLKPGVNRKNKAGIGIAIGEISEIEKDNKIRRTRIDNVNESLKVYSEYLNIPIFDLNNVYKKVHEGRFITHDGIPVTIDYKNGNFYSTDGNFLSAFGQAVIANELIKTINSFYKTDIPLINTKGFLNKN